MCIYCPLPCPYILLQPSAFRRFGYSIVVSVGLPCPCPYIHTYLSTTVVNIDTGRASWRGFYTHTATGTHQLSVMAILHNTDSTYIDVWPGTTCSLAWLVVGCNRLGGGKTSYPKYINTSCGPARQIFIYKWGAEG
jgi:hypothetical protein